MARLGGNQYEVRALLSDPLVRSVWSRAGAEIGRSTYRLKGSRFELVDSLAGRDGSLREINRLQLCRVAASIAC